MFNFAKYCWFLTGPTASGKSDLAIDWALEHNAEILSMDSAAIYRRMDIGTAKPSPEQRATVPHHLLDIANPSEEFSVAQYCEAAGACVEGILARGKVPLFVGGTPLYLKALLRGLFDGPGADWSIRQELQEVIDSDGLERLHAMLEEIDPVAAAKLHVNDARRVIRAIEVYRLTGKPISQWQQEHDKPIPQKDCRVYALEVPKPELDARIAVRVDAMLKAGLIDEVRRLIQFDSPLSRTASQAVGYREPIQWIANDETAPLSELRDEIILHTRQLAKRQMTWFRGLSECRIINNPQCFRSIIE